MTEDEALAWVEAHPVAGPKIPVLRRYVDMLTAENIRQNLISPHTVGQVWARHIVDSLQLWDLADFQRATSVDIGSGGGLPGVVLGILGARITLCEPRRLRVEFLRTCLEMLPLERATICQAKGAGLASSHDLVTARAVTSPTALIEEVGLDATYALPAGRGAELSLQALRRSYDGVFHVKRSVTSADSWIIIASELKRRSS